MPELLAISNNIDNKPKIYFYEWFERVKETFKEIVDYWDYMNEPFLTFVGTQDMDERFEEFLNENLLNIEKHKNPTRAIIADSKSQYSKYHVDMHNTLVISDPIFEMWNEIVIYDNKVAVLSYKKDEIYTLIIESNVLSKWLKSMFNLIWKLSKEKNKKNTKMSNSNNINNSSPEKFKKTGVVSFYENWIQKELPDKKLLIEKNLNFMYDKLINKNIELKKI